MGKITDRVKSFEDACKIKGIAPESVIAATDTKDEAAYKKIKVIAEVLNEGWTPDWKDSDQYKYFPWFWMDKSGVGFSYHVFDCGSSAATVGSRLCFKSRELAIYMGEQFTELYKDFMVL